MNRISEPTQRIFWDNCVWFVLFGLAINESPESRQAKVNLLNGIALPSIEFSNSGIIFSTSLYLDNPKNVNLETFQSQVRQFEQNGYATIVDHVLPMTQVAILRNQIRLDVSSNPVAFEGVKVTSISIGDTLNIFAALRENCDEFWTWDPLLLALSERASIRGLKTCVPHQLTEQGVLPFR